MGRWGAVEHVNSTIQVEIFQLSFFLGHIKSISKIEVFSVTILALKIWKVKY